MDLGATFSELSHLLTQAIVLPGGQRRGSGRPGTKRGQDTAGGTVVVAAGQLPDDLVPTMIHRAGGRRCRAVVVPTGHLDFGPAGERYVRYLTRFGMQGVQVAELVTRQQAADPNRSALLAAADLILVGGGDGHLLLDILAETPAETALHQALERGAVLCFAGGAASAAGELALASSGAFRRGLGLLPHCAIDRTVAVRAQMATSFLAFCRQGRGGPLGLFLDEGAAIAATGHGLLEVRGEGAVMAAWPATGRQLTVHVLIEGWRLDLTAKRIYPPARGALSVASAPLR